MQALATEELDKSCIAVRRHIDIERYSAALSSAGIAFHKVDHNTLDDNYYKGVRIATIHRVKGIEFDNMYVAGANDDVLPLDTLHSNGLTIIREHEQRERSLLYVAITRAKRFCSVSGFGHLSRFIK